MSKQLLEYVVVADAVNVTTGKKTNGRPQVTRVERGATINAPADHPSIVDLVGMGGVCLKSDLRDHAKSLNEKSGRRRPAVVKEHGQPRITAAGTALSLASEDDLPEQPVDGVVPTEAPDPDLTPVDA